MKKFLIALSLLCGTLSAAEAAEFPPEIVEAYKQGRADWDRGDLVSAMTPLRTAADAGHPAAQALFGYLLDQADNDAEAAAYFRKSAEQGDAEGMFGLAGLLANGDGVVQDKAEARKFFSLAAEAGHKQATIVMASAYLQASLGLTENDRQSAEALRWLRAAAQLDHLPSLQRLIAAHQKGEMGLSPDQGEVDRLQNRVNVLLGIDPKAEPKKRRRRS